MAYTIAMCGVCKQRIHHTKRWVHKDTGLAYSPDGGHHLASPFSEGDPRRPTGTDVPPEDGGDATAGGTSPT